MYRLKRKMIKQRLLKKNNRRTIDIIHTNVIMIKRRMKSKIRRPVSIVTRKDIGLKIAKPQNAIMATIEVVETAEETAEVMAEATIITAKIIIIIITKIRTTIEAEVKAAAEDEERPTAIIIMEIKIKDMANGQGKTKVITREIKEINLTAFSVINRDIKRELVPFEFDL